MILPNLPIFTTIDYNTAMKIEELSGKSIRLLGKSRALKGDEFAARLKVHDIVLISSSDEKMDYIVEGRMINPIEQDEFDALYEQKAAPFITIDELEQTLCESIDGSRLLMSLKLSGDKERLLGYLQNRFIDNALFLKLLALYDWQGEGFFENDVNRDVTAALITRFYENIERNHNVQYANMGLMHLIAQTDDSELIETIALLTPLQDGLRNGCDNSTRKILFSIAEEPATPEHVLKRYIRSDDVDIKTVIALRAGISPALQKELLTSEHEIITEALSFNPSLDTALALTMLDDYGENIASHCRLESGLFEMMIERFPQAVALNSSLDLDMQLRLIDLDTRVNASLASNENVDVSIQRRLFETGMTETIEALAGNAATTVDLLEEIAAHEEYYEALASNVNTPEAIFHTLFASSKAPVLAALAQNRSTPTELLYQLQVDQRFARYVMENPGFGEYIQKENIGWLV